MVSYGYSDGYGYGYGDGFGYGDSNGYSDGNGYGDCYGHGGGGVDGSGYGFGDGNEKIFVPHDTPIIAYWYIGDDNRSHYGEKLTAKVGDIHELNPGEKVKMCKFGLHASWTPEQAAKYRDGTLCKVACSGWMQFREDKLDCSRREILAVLT
jgi:hypothetical protein